MTSWASFPGLPSWVQIAALKAMPSGCSLFLDCASVFGEFGVCVLLDWVALYAFRLGSDADVNGHPSAVEDCIGDDVAWSQSL